MKPDKPKPRLWPRYAVGPLGNRALFDCMGDIPHGWMLEAPLPGHPSSVDIEDVREALTAPIKRGPGRPRKVDA